MEQNDIKFALFGGWKAINNSVLVSLGQREH